MFSISGDGIASGMQMLAMALNPRIMFLKFSTRISISTMALHPYFHMATTIVRTPLTRSSVPSQFNRIGSEEVMQSIPGQEPILGPTGTLLED